MVDTATLQSDDFYERLGVERSATTEEIKRAYRALLRRYPPERAPEEFKRIREAYETLGDAHSRAEYDRRPDPLIEQWLASGMHAMKGKQYDLAERYFKQVLLQLPDLGYVRNLLGLSLLYRGDPLKAVAQFERLLVQPDAPAAWFGNAGHAYQSLGRRQDAERAFQEAIRRATDNLADYIVGLADVYLDGKQFAKAGKVLEDGIKADGAIDFQDLRYFTKLLETRLREGELDKVERVLERMKVIATDEEQRAQISWQLGIIGQHLVGAQSFRFAIPVVHLARELQPEDADYFALEEIARCLEQNDFSRAGQLLRGHVSFATGGWLHELGQTIGRYMDQHRAFDRMKPITSPPPLYTLNGIGTTVYGQRDADPYTGSYVKTLYFVFLFIPLFPIACYRVIPRGENRWSFLGRVPFAKREKWHLALTFGLLTFAILRGVLSLPPSYSTYAASTATSTPSSAQPLSPSRSPITPTKAGAAKAQAFAVYRGSVTNSGTPDQPGSLEITVTSPPPKLSGYIAIGAPLGGSGSFVGEVRRDSLILLSISSTGDTIVWIGQLSRDEIGSEKYVIDEVRSGRYAITGGQYQHQGGVWTVALRSGTPLRPAPERASTLPSRSHSSVHTDGTKRPSSSSGPDAQTRGAARRSAERGSGSSTASQQVFRLGSNKGDVIVVQGAPDKLSTDSLDEQVWHYGRSSVTFARSSGW